MNLKLQRVQRTSQSEESAIFDGDTRDENNQAVNIGKLEVHFLNDQIVGTLLLWQEFAQGYKAMHGAGSEETIDDLIDAILTEMAEPLGLPAEYGIEVYYPSVTNQLFISNYSGDEGEDEEEYDDSDEDLDEDESAPTKDDDYYRKLINRP
jgi:hypothetical protein